MFTKGPFVSKNGITPLPFKIECDSLTDDDWAAIAKHVADKIKFCRVVSIPRGGDKFALALQPYISPTGFVLIVGDVTTTGKSLIEMAEKIASETDDPLNIVGVVLFARGITPSWVWPLFRESPI